MWSQKEYKRDKERMEEKGGEIERNKRRKKLEQLS